MKTPLVILHGWGASSRSFDKIKELLEQKGISVFVFDLPGFGKENSPPSAWSVDDYVEWVREWMEKNILSRHPELVSGSNNSGLYIEDEMPKQVESKLSASKRHDDKDKFILLGHSFGGRLAIKFAAKYQEKLVGLILCDAAGITPRPKVKINIFNIISKIGKVIFSWPILKYFQPIVRKIEYFLAGSRDYYYLQDPIMKETFKKIIEEDLTLYLDKIMAPTLIVWGKKDKMTPVSDAYVMNKKIAGSKLEILENIGHSPHLECPEELSEIVEKFIKK